MSMMLYNMFMPSSELCLLIEPNQIYSSPKQFVNLETRKMHLDVGEVGAAFRCAEQHFAEQAHHQAREPFRCGAFGY